MGRCHRGISHALSGNGKCLALTRGLLPLLLALQRRDLGFDILETVATTDRLVSQNADLLFNRLIEDGDNWQAARGSRTRVGMLNRDRGEVEIGSVDEYNDRVILNCIDCRQTGGIGGASRRARFHQDKGHSLIRFGGFFFDFIEIFEVFEEHDTIGNNQRFRGVERRRPQQGY